MTNWNKVLMHSIYVGGTALFASLGNFFTQGPLTGSEVTSALTTSFIAFGSAFFLAWGLTNNEDTPSPPITTSSFNSKQYLKKGTSNIIPFLRNIVFIK